MLDLRDSADRPYRTDFLATEYFIERQGYLVDENFLHGRRRMVQLQASGRRSYSDHPTIAILSSRVDHGLVGFRLWEALGGTWKQGCKELNLLQ